MARDINGNKVVLGEYVYIFSLPWTGKVVDIIEVSSSIRNRVDLVVEYDGDFIQIEDIMCEKWANNPNKPDFY